MNITTNNTTKITFTIITTLVEAQKWWEFFSSNESLFDTWELRYCFYKYFNYPLSFLLGTVDGQSVGLLPMQFNTDVSRLEFFGGSWFEDNRIFIRPGFENCIPEFFKQVTQPAKLEFITGTDTFITSLPIIDYKYLLPLGEFHKSKDYIEKYYHGETKKKFNKRIKKVKELDITIEQNNEADLEMLIQYNLANFEDKSTFLYPHRQEIYRDLIKLPFQHLLTTFVCQGEKIAISLAFLYKNTYYSFKATTKPDSEKNLIDYVRMVKIAEALKHKMTAYDALASDCGWKENWYFTRKPQYIFEIKKPV
jgi:hypothetical protein